MKRTILVSGASGIVGYGVLRSLRHFNDYRLIGTTIYNESIAPAFCDVFELAVPTNNENYIDWLCSVIKKHSVDMVIPGIEADMYSWNDHREELEKSGAVVLLNQNRLVNLCKDKWVFYKELVDVIPDYLIPTSDDLSSNIYGFPYILKPKKGFGSKGIIRINDERDYANNKEKMNNDLIMQPIVGTDDEEYTVSAFFDFEHSLIDYLALKRKLSPNGYTDIAEVVDYDFSEILRTIADAVKPLGPTNFQFRFTENSVKLLEINPRISSSTSIRAAFGYNESKMSIDYFLENKVPQKIDKQSINGKKAIRYVEEYIF
jgi:carbamoyl-phosphate synthase large subunit